MELLGVLAVCGPSRLPLSLFKAAWEGAQIDPLANSMAGESEQSCLTAWHVSHLPSLVMSKTDSWDSFRLIEAIHLLKLFSLVSTDTSDGYMSVSMHPLVHAWARDRQTTDQQHTSWLKTGCLVALSFEDDALWQIQARQLQSHLRALVLAEMKTMFRSEPEIVHILVRCGLRLSTMRDDVTLSLLLTRLFESLRIAQSTVDAQWLLLYTIYGQFLQECGRLQEAVRMLETVLDIQLDIQSQTQQVSILDLLRTEYSLAGAYRSTGQVQEAVAMLEQVVRIRRQISAEDHPHQLASQHALAMVYRDNRQIQEAVTMLEVVVRVRRCTLAEDHPDRLASQYELATAYADNGQVQKAVKLLEEVVRIEAQTSAEDYPDLLASQHALAVVYNGNGRVQEAITMMEQVVKVRQNVLDKQHPDRQASESWLEHFLENVNLEAEASSDKGSAVSLQIETEAPVVHASRSRSLQT